MITLTGLTKRYGDKTARWPQRRDHARYFPNIAGDTFIGADQLYSPVVGLLTLIGWADAALLAGAVALYTRDA